MDDFAHEQEMSQDRGPLSKLAERVRKDSPLPVYSFAGTLPGEDSIYWSGEDLGEFLAFAKQVGAPVVYLNESVVEEDELDPEYSLHIGQTWAVSAAFLLDGRFHTFYKAADWVPREEAAEGGPGTGQEALHDAQAILEKRQTELVDEFLREYRTAGIRFDPSEFGVDRAFRRFLAPRLSTPALGWGPYGIPNDRTDLDLAIEKTVREVARRLLSEEREKAESLVPDATEWANRNGIRSLSRSDVDGFLLERKVDLSTEGRRYLWTKAKLAVKVGR